MAQNLQVDKPLLGGATVSDQDGNVSPLALSTERAAVGILFSFASFSVTEFGAGESTVLFLRRDESSQEGDPALGVSFKLDPTNRIFNLDVGGQANSTARIHLGDSARADNPVTTLGAVGIGTVDPKEKLEVQGNVRATGTGTFGGNGSDGQLVVRDSAGERILVLQAGTGDLKIGGHGKDGDITLFPASAADIGSPAQATIHLDGEAGDIRLLNADAAEEFEVMTHRPPEPGDVMILGDSGSLRLCDTPYDRRVAGVVSGAGGHRPGIILGHDESRPGRVQLALMGRVYCKAIADGGPISVGDLLTTSSVPGHAMRVSEQGRAFGSVLGKAIGRLERGTGLVEALVALQ